VDKYKTFKIHYDVTHTLTGQTTGMNRRVHIKKKMNIKVKRNINTTNGFESIAKNALCLIMVSDTGYANTTNAPQISGNTQIRFYP
jgi:hypothetical protein